MEHVPVQGVFITTSGGNKMSSNSMMMSMDGKGNKILNNIRIDGKNVIEDGTIIRGDFHKVNIGMFVILSKDSILRPPQVLHKDKLDHIPMTIGSYVFVGEGSVVQAAVVSSFVHIGKNCVIGPRCILKECSRVADNTVLTADTIVPAFTLYSGNPGKYKEDLPESTETMMKDLTMTYYVKLGK